MEERGGLSQDGLHRVILGSGAAIATRWTRALVVLMLALAFVATTQAASADASVFLNRYHRYVLINGVEVKSSGGLARWPTRSDGYTLIPVCFTANSSAAEKNDVGIHDPNPSLGDVVGQVRDALRVNWEAYSSVRFVGWQVCSTLTQAERDEAVGLHIHRDAPNNSQVGIVTKGRYLYDRATGNYKPGTNFKPWGNNDAADAKPPRHDAHCIDYNAARAVMEYRFSCVREYAVHEFGHVIGFAHEWQHPQTPLSCSRTQKDEDGNLIEQPVRPSRDLYSDTYDPRNFDWTIANLYSGGFDRDSIMTYGEPCADVTGERFGSRNLDSWDRIGVTKVYPPVQPRPYDVGVIPQSSGDCPRPTAVKIYMDNEDSDNANRSSGWIGAISSGRNTSLEFCKVDGRRLGRLPAPTSGSANYAVLKLGDTCPPGSTEFVRYHDDEDQPPLNTNWMAGEVGPTRQNSAGTELHWCLFEQVSAGGGTATMDFLPALGFRYGVLAPPGFSRAQSTGSVHTDDEDTENKNRLTNASGGGLSPGMGAVVGKLVAAGRNTTLYLALVDLPPPPPRCLRPNVCPE
jgi:hypothetical protein